MIEMTGVVQRVLAAGLLVGALAGCSKIPDAQRAYIGEWQGANIKLKVTRNGWVDYRREADDQRVGEAAAGGLAGFDGNDIVIGPNMSQRVFTVPVTAPPHQENGRWTMSVDGVKVSRD